MHTVSSEELERRAKSVEHWLWFKVIDVEFAWFVSVPYGICVATIITDDRAAVCCWCPMSELRRVPFDPEELASRIVGKLRGAMDAANA